MVVIDNCVKCLHVIVCYYSYQALPSMPECLLVVICQLRTNTVDGNALSLTLLSLDFEEGLQRLFRICSSMVRNFFPALGGYWELPGLCEMEFLAQGVQLFSSGSCYSGLGKHIYAFGWFTC